MCVHECVKCRDVSECIVMWRTVPEAHVDVERLEFACNRVATAAEGTTSQAPPQGEAAHGTEGAPSELSFAAPQGLIPRREVHRDGGRTILSGIAPGVRIPDMFYFLKESTRKSLE